MAKSCKSLPIKKGKRSFVIPPKMFVIRTNSKVGHKSIRHLTIIPPPNDTDQSQTLLKSNSGLEFTYTFTVSG